MNKLWWIVLGAVVVIGAVVWVNPGSDNKEEVMEKDDAMVKDDQMMDKSSPSPDAMMKKDGDAMMSYTGTVLAGTNAPLLNFVKADYDAALKTDKLVVLYFYANWCPICKVEFPKMQDAFNELTSDNVIAFRVNFNDSDTGRAEEDLARQFGVAYQHTKVFLKNGQQVLKSPESWDKARYLSEINSRL